MTTSTTGRVATRQLEPGPEETLVWVVGGLGRVQEALEADLDGPTAGAAVDDLLRLMVVLRDRRGSPDAAADLADAVRAVPGAVSVVRRRHVAVNGIDALRTFARREGRGSALTAPPVEAEVPQGATPLKSLLDPTDRDRARQIARRRKELEDGRR